MSDVPPAAANPDNSPGTLLNLLPGPCALVDAAGVVRTVNAAWRDYFVNTGQGHPLRESCARLFNWQPQDWQAFEGELNCLLNGELPQISFEALLAEPPERWCSCMLAAHPASGSFVWQLVDVTRWQLSESESLHSYEQLRDAIESISDGFALFDSQDRLVFCNRRYREIYAQSADLMITGRRFEEIMRVGVRRGQYVEAVGREEAFIAEQLAAHQNLQTVEQQLPGARWVRTVERRTADGGIVGIRSDITELRRADELRRESELQAELIRNQSALLAELSTPLLRIGAKVLLLPLVGSVDNQRAARMTESLLQAAAEEGAQVVILDVTGVPVVDTQVASVLIQCARSVRLLGAHMVLTGIRPDVAQTIITLGIDLSDVVTRADLEEGIRYALRRQ